jgi:cytochrome c-type biogenesis protein CcmH/NrfG
MSIPLPGGVEEMDLLIREPAPPVQVMGLTPTDEVEMEAGVRYRRFTGVGVQEDRLEVVQLPSPRGIPVRWLAVLLALILAGAGIYAVQRAPAGAPRPAQARPAAPPGRQELVRQVAELDEALEGMPPGAERNRLLGRRQALVARLRQGE